MFDLALDAPKCATVTQFALPKGCCWRCSLWPWVFQSVQLSNTLLSQRGAVGGVRSSLGCSNLCMCHPFCSPRGVLLEVLALGFGAPRCATVTQFALPEKCCWWLLIWTWVPQSVQLSRHLLSQRGLLLEVLDLALGAPKCATVTPFARSEGYCWRVLIWPWVLQSVQLSHSLLSQRGAVRESCSGLGCSKVCNCHAVWSPAWGGVGGS